MQKKFNLKKICLIIAGFAVLFVANDYFHIGGKEISWFDLASDEAVITVEELSNGEVIASHALNKGQSIAMQTLLLNGGYLRTYAANVQPKAGESTYHISIQFPEQDVSLQVIGDRYISNEIGWLKISDKEWDTIFHGILAAG